ncbi:glycoside hydrolase [uncultured Polaribacter sp.]|uniref:glycoside hydrolase n=1 Tax=uncultured Polaribacter sp. TaxID=174711 RepID=UPI00262D2A10|nr:glycoside hydrolase [uncultured Polaribacter sp.]
MKSIKYNFKLLYILLFFMCFKNVKAQTNITIDPEIEHQTIEGWGVSLAWWANLVGGFSQDAIDEIAGYAVNDLNFNVFRFNISGGENPNCTEGDHFRKDGALIPNYRSPQNDNQGWGTADITKDFRQISVMNKIAELRAPKGDIITEMISYSPPWWMTHGECSAGNVEATDENLKPEFRDDFADYLASVSKELSTAYPSWNISYIVPFNEPTSGFWRKGGNQEGSAIYPQTQAEILFRLNQRLIALDIPQIKMSGSDNSKVPWSLTNMRTMNNNNPFQYNSLAKITTHSYGGSWQEKAALANYAKTNGNKPVWQTETGPLGWVRDGRSFFARHYDIAYRLVEDLRNLKATVWCDWQLMSRDDGWGMLHQTNWDENIQFQEPVLNKTRGFYCRKNVTNFIKVGYKIIQSNDHNTISAISPDNSEAVLVIVNSSEQLKEYTIDLSNFSFVNSYKAFRTSGLSNNGENTVENTIPNINLKGQLTGKSIRYNAPAYSVSTFVVDISNPLSTSAFRKEDFKMYPIPFSIESTFSFPRKLVDGNLVIYNTLGMKVKEYKNINNKQVIINRENLDNGIYFYKLKENRNTLTSGKLVIK